MIEGEPVTLHWPFYRNVHNFVLPIILLIGLLLLRRPAAWLVLLPILAGWGLIQAGYGLLETLELAQSDMLVLKDIGLLVLLGIALLITSTPLLLKSSGWKRAGMAILIGLLIPAIPLPFLGLIASMLYLMMAIPLIITIVTVAARTRKGLSIVRFFLKSLLGFFLIGCLVFLAIIVIQFAAAGIGFTYLMEALVQMLIISLILSLVLGMLLLPFLILIRFSPYHHDQACRLFTRRTTNGHESTRMVPD